MMSTPIESMTFSLGTVQWLLMAAVAIYAWWVGRQSATLKEVVALRERVVELEVQMKQVPSQQAIAEMNAKLSALGATLDGVSTSMRPINANLERINTYLLNNK